jgi:hypothetical protein
MKQFVLRAAARTNAEWCASMSRSHGLTGEFELQAWTVSARVGLGAGGQDALDGAVGRVADRDRLAAGRLQA